MSRVLGILILATVVVTTAPATARTWRVEQDGSGDFTVIQDAIDAASAGDVIAIGPGTYQDYTFAWFNGQWNVYSCAFVTKDNLTLQGAGQGLTIIGLPNLDDHPNLDINGIGMIDNATLHIRELTVRGVDLGVHFEQQYLDIYHCEFISCDSGIGSWGTGSNTIQYCSIRDSVHDSIHMASSAENVNISNCEIVGGSLGIYLPSVPSAVVADCVLQGSGTAISIGLGGFSQIVRCGFIEYENCALSVSGGASVQLINSHIFEGRFGISFIGDGRLEGHGNVIEGCSQRTLLIQSATDVEFCGNQILPGEGPSVEARASQWLCPETCHLNLIGNYWGTDDAEEIAGRIIDYYDFDPPSGWYRAIVDFIPFEGGVVTTERQTWGAVKSLYRDATR